VLEKSLPTLQKTLTSCESTTGSPSRSPLGTATTKLQVVVLTSAATVLEPSCRPSPIILVQTPADPLKLPTATLAAEAVTAEAPKPWSQQEGRWRRRSRRPRPREQPCPRSFTRRLRCPPEDRRIAAEEVRHCRRQRRLPRLLSSASQLTPPGQVQASGNHQV
jgi:hypothetical protein